MLDLWVLVPFSFPRLIFLKFQELFFYCGLPLAGVGFLFSFLEGFALPKSLWFLASVALGLPSLLLVGLMVSSFKLGARGGVFLMALLLFPLYLPVLLLGMSIFSCDNPGGSLKGLCGLLLINLVCCPVFGGWALRQAVMR